MGQKEESTFGWLKIHGELNGEIMDTLRSDEEQTNALSQFATLTQPECTLGNINQQYYFRLESSFNIDRAGFKVKCPLLENSKNIKSCFGSP